MSPRPAACCIDVRTQSNHQSNHHCACSMKRRTVSHLRQKNTEIAAKTLRSGWKLTMIGRADCCLAYAREHLLAANVRWQRLWLPDQYLHFCLQIECETYQSKGLKSNPASHHRWNARQVHDMDRLLSFASQHNIFITRSITYFDLLIYFHEFFCLVSAAGCCAVCVPSSSYRSISLAIYQLLQSTITRSSANHSVVCCNRNHKNAHDGGKNPGDFSSMPSESAIFLFFAERRSTPRHILMQ